MATVAPAGSVAVAVGAAGQALWVIHRHGQGQPDLHLPCRTRPFHQY